MKRWLIALALLCAHGPASAQQLVPGATPMAISAKAVPLSSEEPGATSLGQLRYAGGFSLTSANEDFGGLSALIVASDETHLIAVTDQAHWVCLTLRQGKDDQLDGIEDAWIAPVRGLDGKALSGRARTDSEGLALSASGNAIFLSFEGKHRLRRYPLHDHTDLCSVASSVPLPITLPRGVQDLPSNGGMEAIATLPGGNLIILSEQGRAKGNTRRGWRIPETGLKNSAALPLHYKAPKPFVPTDMARSGETIYILQRHFSILSGVSGVISKVPAAAFSGGKQVITGEVIARFSPPITVDNLEGLSAIKKDANAVSLYVVSDDNFNPLQKTLLMKFISVAGG